jgi:hypothetical protein
MLPFLNPVSKPKTKMADLIWKGINLNELIADSDLADAENISGDEFPAVAPRASREDAEISITAPHSFYKTADGYAWNDGTDFKYEGTSELTVTAGMKSIVDFQKKLVIFPDKKYYDYDGDTNGTFTVDDGGTPVLFADAIEYGNRIWGIWGKEIWASKWGDFETWDDFAGVNTDSYAVPTVTEGDFVAITKYMNHIVAFKDDWMYELYGYIPSNFELQEVSNIGCIDKRSIREVNGVLYFVARNEVYAYAGGTPKPVGQALDLANVTAAVAGTDNLKYFVSITDDRGTLLYVLDTQTGSWVIEDDLAIKEFACRDKEVHALTTGGDIYQFNSGTEDVSWYATTKFFDAKGFTAEYAKRLLLRLKIAYGASVTISYRVNHGEWRELEAFAQDDASYPYLTEKCKFDVDVREYERFQIKIAGTGEAIVYGAREIIVGGDY